MTASPLLLRPKTSGNLRSDKQCGNDWLHTRNTEDLRCRSNPIVSFHTVDHACIEHGVDYGVFLQALRGAAEEAE